MCLSCYIEEFCHYVLVLLHRGVLSLCACPVTRGVLSLCACPVTIECTLVFALMV